MGIFYSYQSFHVFHYFSDSQVSEYPVFLDGIADLTDVYQGQKLQEHPGIHRRGCMYPQPFHVKLVFQVVKAVFNDVLGAVDMGAPMK